MKLLRLTSLAILFLGTVTTLSSQVYHDDVYFSSGKNKKETTKVAAEQPQQVQQTQQETQAVTTQANNEPAWNNVDAYNRRYEEQPANDQTAADEGQAAPDASYSDANNDGTHSDTVYISKNNRRTSDDEYTERIIRFHSPSKITIAGADQVELNLSNGYYSYGYDTDNDPNGGTTVSFNLNVGNAWDSPYYYGGWSSWFGPYWNSPWYYSWYGPGWGFGWNPFWGWGGYYAGWYGGWYDPWFYGGWYGGGYYGHYGRPHYAYRNYYPNGRSSFARGGSRSGGRAYSASRYTSGRATSLRSSYEGRSSFNEGRSYSFEGRSSRPAVSGSNNGRVSNGRVSGGRASVTREVRPSGNSSGRSYTRVVPNRSSSEVRTEGRTYQ
ncbi:MAG: hypothetical protein LBL81_01155, partial [Tannerella sp.]|nr:hypothetical protein [Tannerella sp.]